MNVSTSLKACAAIALALVASSLGAQQPATPAAAQPAPATRTIDPGMTREQVVGALGEPSGARTVGTRTYLFYRNGVERRAGTQDVVFLENNAVVDAIFRAPGRRYTGTSSSSPSVRPAPTNVQSVPAADAGAPLTAGAAAAPAAGASSTVLPGIRNANAEPNAPMSVPVGAVSQPVGNVSRPASQRPDTAGLRVSPSDVSRPLTPTNAPPPTKRP